MFDRRVVNRLLLYATGGKLAQLKRRPSGRRVLLIRGRSRPLPLRIHSTGQCAIPAELGRSLSRGCPSGKASRTFL